MQRILTEAVFPPIPLQHYNWRAWRDGNEESGPFGYGATKQEAIDNLHDWEAEIGDYSA